MKIIRVFFLFIIFGIFTVAEETALEPITYEIMVLNSYSYEFSLTQDTMRGITDVLNANNLDINLHVEYLDSRKILNRRYYEKIYEIYKHKYNKIKFNLIICSDNDALDFILNYRDDLFNDVPVIFTGINGFKDSILMGDTKITGISENLGIQETLDTALKLHKNIEKVVIVNDKTYSGKLIKKIIKEQEKTFSSKVKFIYLDDFNIGLADLPAFFDKIGENAIIFHTFYTIDKYGRKISPKDFLSKMYSHVKIPIYGIYEENLGKGIVGGYLVNRYLGGRAAADMAVLMLRGKDISTFGVVEGNYNSFKFDYKELKKYGVSEALLPKNSAIINKNPYFYERNKNIINSIALFSLALIFIIIVLILNIMKVRKLNTIIKRNMDFIRNVIDSGPGLYSVKDGGGKIFLANRAFSEFYGVDLSKIEGQYYEDIAVSRGVHIEDYLSEIEEDHNVIENKTNQIMIEKKLRLITGEVRWFQVNRIPITIDGVKYYSLCVELDITERKNMELELKEEKEKAIESNETKTLFLANMSHEIRTPINGIIGMTEILKRESVTEKQRRSIEIIDRSSEHLLSIINDILDISKIESGKMRFEKREFNIRKEIRKSTEIFAEIAARKNIEIISYVSPNVPEIVLGDSFRLLQILSNIIGNAVKFTEKGEVIINVDLVENISGANVKLKFSVEDTGIGIPEDRFGAIFKKFSQVDDSHSRKYGGTGLGLAISKEIIEKMNGEIAFKSKENKGSLFYFTIELGKKKEYNIPEFNNMEILLIEENARVLKNLSKVFNDWRCPFTAADSIEEAIEILDDYEKIREHLIVMLDENIAIGENVKNIGILVDAINEKNMTSVDKVIIFECSKDSGRKNIEKNGIRHFIYKPIDQELLIKTINKMLDVGSLEIQQEESNEKMFMNDRILKVLIVEDNEVNYMTLADMLEKIGRFQITHSQNGEKAISLLSDMDFDIIFMDIQLPNMNGFEITEIIRKNDIATPIIAVTAHAIDGYRDKCIEAGMNDYISKPFRIRKLHDAVAKIYELKRVDVDKLEEEFSNDKNLLQKVFKKIEDNYPAFLVIMNSAAKEKDYETIQKEAHKMKGALGNIKAKKSIEYLNRIEKLCEMRNSEEIKKIIHELEYEFEEIKKIIKIF